MVIAIGGGYTLTFYDVFIFITQSTGWGSTYGSSPDSPILQQAEVPIIDHAECAKRNNPINTVVYDMMICAGGNGKVMFTTENFPSGCIFLSSFL